MVFYDIVVGSGLSYPSSNLNEAVCISHGANTLGKGMNPTIHYLLSNIGTATSIIKGKFNQF